MLELICVNSLAKIFADEEHREQAYVRATSLLNETFAFQVAYRSNAPLKSVRVKVESLLANVVTVRNVGLVPSELPTLRQESCDGWTLRTTPGLFPDPLLSLEKGRIDVPPGQWRALWVSVAPADGVVSGSYPIRIILEGAEGNEIGCASFELELIDAYLPEQELIHTEWFHADCLATHYEVEMFSEAHWQLIERYIDTAARHGINMILTPLFTPPLDTEVGGERPTVQLVDVIKDGDHYQFGFDKLERWTILCERLGVNYFEYAHLFTQWGAKHAPKVMAVENGEQRRIFGWDTDASSPEYRSFLSQFLPELVQFIRARKLERRCYFHISDEPHSEHLEQYRDNRAFLEQFLSDFPIIDALSDYAFYEQGIVGIPIPANDHMEPFISGGVKPLWTYYCVAQELEVSNRFFSFPSARNRIIGIQLYKYNIEGFLHWGYNFWYTQFSRKAIDPFKITDAGLAFCSGDAYLVYPGEDGPIESIRMEVLYEALQDLRALKLLESLVGRTAVLELIEEGLEEPITFTSYPHSADWLLQLRERINRAIAIAMSVEKEDATG
ncbi:hypothetical protein J40TS1_31070 [Paenibacillus montaniterrae]|uniref:Glycoside hydrolase 123 catalytic domain-containing protein n=1 Tax=Paenibacillus montaniterrae TaxID=429341 RepID=A0A920CYJ4_9BACL|nr:hypothetical protein J40TS1_31070 [Paenibacillus montaniterrae]